MLTFQVPLKRHIFQIGSNEVSNPIDCHLIDEFSNRNRYMQCFDVLSLDQDYYQLHCHKDSYAVTLQVLEKIDDLFLNGSN